MCHASKERVLLIGTDQRITSGPAARTAAFRGRIHGCTRTIRANVRFSSCTAGAVHTWHIAAKGICVGLSAGGESGHDDVNSPPGFFPRLPSLLMRPAGGRCSVHPDAAARWARPAARPAGPDRLGAYGPVLLPPR